MSRLSFTLCLLGALSAAAQLYPVQVTSTLIPPYSVHLHHYAAAGASSFNVLIHPLELDRTDLRVKLRLTIEGAGVTLQTRANYLPPPLILQGGVPEMLTGYDLRHYFNPDNMEILGMTRREFLQGGRLPEGYYTFRVEVLEYTRGVNLSAPNGGQATAWMVLNDPPFINFPFNNEKIQASIPQNIFFNWTPRHLASPNSAFSTEYDFVLIEMYPGHTNPEEAIRSSRSIYSLTTSSPTLVYGIAEPMLTPGKKYAFRVRARDTSGRDLFKNQGWSETHMFQYGDACLPVVGPTAEGISAHDVKVEWEADPAHTGFQVYIREATSDHEWWVYTAPVRTRTIGGLKPSTAYSYRVQPLCGSVKGDLTTIYEVKTLEEGTSLPSACGVQPPLIPDGEKNSRVLLQKPLMPLDKIKIGDDIIIIVKAEQQPDGSYTGEGRLPFPFATDVFLKVKLHNAFVNEHYRVFSGSYITTYNLNSKVKGHIDDLLAELERERKKAEKEWDKNGGGGGTGPVLDTTSAPSEVIPVAGEIQDVVVSSDSTSTAGEALALAGDTGEEDIKEEGPANPDFPTTGEGSSLVVEGGGDRGLAGGDPPAGGGSATDGTGAKAAPYTLPLTVVYLDDQKEFTKGDTITVASHITRVTLLIKDAEDRSIELLSTYFPDNAGEISPPGFTVDTERLKEDEIKQVKIMIPQLDTLLVYVERHKPILEMNQSDILALLADLHIAQKENKTFCDLSPRLTSYSTGDIEGELGKVKVNEKYDMQKLKLQLTNQGHAQVSLKEVKTTIKEEAGKEVVVFTFKGEKDKPTLELTVGEKDREFIEWYLLGKKPLFKITTTLVTDDKYATVSSFTINRGTFSGYFLERPEGTATEERTAGSYKRIPEGHYIMCYTYKQCRAETTRSHADSETWIKTYGEPDYAGAAITRDFVLIHLGNYPWNSAGCLLIGGGYQNYTLEENYFENETGIIYKKGLVIKKIVSSGDKLVALNNEYKKVIDLTKKFGTDCETNKCYELEIDINR